MAQNNHTEWLEALSEWLSNQPEVEAIRVDTESKEISIATLGAAKDEEKLRVAFQTVIERIEHQLSLESSQIKVNSKPSSNSIEIRELGQDTLIERKSCPTAPKFWHWRKIPWPEEEHSHVNWRTLLTFTILSGIFGAFAFFTENYTGFSYIAPLLYGISMIFGGWDACSDAMSAIKKRELDIHFLMLVVAVGASIIGQFGEGALLLFLFSLSGTFEHFALERSTKEIESLYEKKPKTALLLTDEGELTVPVDQVSLGSLIRVRAGDTIPLDGVVVEGSSSANESALTGESIPIDKGMGDKVYGGSINESGTIVVKVIHMASDSTIQRILSMIQESSKMKTRVESMTERYGSRYTLFVLSITALSFSIWAYSDGIPVFHSTADETSAFYKSMTLLVVLSPCALVLSVPSALLASIAWGAKRGILFRGGSALEKMNDVGIVAMDKTGTLTTGDLNVCKIESYPPGNESLVGKIAYSMELRASHPIATAISNHGKENDYKQCEVTDFRSMSGFGLKAEVNGKTCILGRREILSDLGELEFLKSLKSNDEDCIEVWLIQGDLVGRILLKDKIREESYLFIKELKKLGKKVVMLTGDRLSNAKNVADSLGITDVYAQLLPENKVDKIRDFTKEKPVMMIGDGVNDAPSLKLAHVSVAMGAKGSGIALESSEVVLMDDSLKGVLSALHLANRTKRIIWQNLFISMGTVLIMGALVLEGSVHLAHGVIAHEGSTVIVCINSLRLLWLNK